MTTPLTSAQQAQQSNRTNDGKYTTKNHSEADVSLGLSAAQKPTFDQLRDTPTDDDIRLSYDDAHRELPFYASNWREVMGEKRRTKGNMATYSARLDEMVDQDPKASARRQRTAQDAARLNSWGRAYQQDVPIDPVAEAKFEEIWDSQLWDDEGYLNHVNGYGKELLEHRLEEYQGYRRGLENGTVKPREMIKGASMRSAVEYVDHNIQQHQEALATRGRSFRMNAYAVEHMLKQRRKD
ncbi:hypothetical protein GCM10009720_08710 [Yaniella flava]|uniref:Uncharacterized protein n=1 Tax=Yaniella flava TaxID=287930 RepID=A0ABN2U9H2_9MICC